MLFHRHIPFTETSLLCIDKKNSNRDKHLIRRGVTLKQVDPGPVELS